MSLFVFRAFALIAGLTVAAIAAEQLWTCGMHPQIIKKQPGNCPICGMALTPVRANTAGKSGKAGGSSGEKKIKHYKSTMSAEVGPKPAKDSMGMAMVPVYEDETPSDAQTIQIDAVTIQRMNLKTDVVTRGPVKREIRTVGTVTYDERSLHDITTKYEGWIEKLHVNATWSVVKAGDPLFEIYSPDLYNAQLNYLVALRGEGKEGGPLTRAALGRLQLFDVSREFIDKLASSGEVQRAYLFRARIDGVVIDKMVIAGQMVKPGERIFRLANLSHVWVQAQIYENALPFVRPGQAAIVRATYGHDRELSGEVALVLPQVEEQTRTATARIVLSNPDGELRPGMFVDVRFSAQIADASVLVPEMAVLRSGERNTVFIARDGGSFDPREVKLGARTQDGRYQVLEGLKEGERVVTSGQFMLDSESQLREAIQKMIKTSEGPAEAARPDAAPAKSAESAAAPQSFDERVPESMKVLAFALADAAAPLAADDLAGYRKQLPALRTALTGYLESAPQNPLIQFKETLVDPADLESARRAFEPFSTAVADLARRHRLPQTNGLHVFECPMAPVGGKGRWLQREAGTKNPFLGTKMPNCGEELK